MILDTDNFAANSTGWIASIERGVILLTNESCAEKSQFPSKLTRLSENHVYPSPDELVVTEIEFIPCPQLLVTRHVQFLNYLQGFVCRKWLNVGDRITNRIDALFKLYVFP